MVCLFFLPSTSYWLISGSDSLVILMAISLCLADLIALIGQLTVLGKKKHNKVRQYEQTDWRKSRGGGQETIEEIVPSFHLFQTRFCQPVFIFLSLWLLTLIPFFSLKNLVCKVSLFSTKFLVYKQKCQWLPITMENLNSINRSFLCKICFLLS